MKKIFVALVLCAGVVFLGLIGYAWIAPNQFVGNTVLLQLFRASGTLVFIGIIYFIGRLYREGMKRASR